MDDNKQSADDALQPADSGVFNPQTDGQKLEGDFDSPAADPGDVPGKIDETDPETDSDIDPAERYDEGLKGATDTDATEEHSHDGPRPLNT